MTHSNAPKNGRRKKVDPLSPARLKALKSICAYVDQHGFAPSYGELAGRLKVSIAMARKHVDKLVEAEYLQLLPIRYRHWKLTAKGIRLCAKK